MVEPRNRLRDRTLFYLGLKRDQEGHLAPWMQPIGPRWLETTMVVMLMALSIPVILDNPLGRVLFQVICLPWILATGLIRFSRMRRSRR